MLDDVSGLEGTERMARESGRLYALRRIREDIVRLRLPPGARVSENELAQRLGLSRTPVREALIELEKVGIVEVCPQRVSRVAPIRYDLIEQACFMREALECAVASRLCEMDSLDWSAIKENVALQAFYRRQSSREQLWKLDNAFHSGLFSLSGMARVGALVADMTVHFDRVRRMSLAVTQTFDTVDDHALMLELLERRDAPAAVNAMRTHLRRYRIDRAEILSRYPDYAPAEEP